MDPIIRKSRLISIHTPAKGVTIDDIQRVFEIAISIHTPAKGVTEMSRDTSVTNLDFNPHSREGRD